MKKYIYILVSAIFAVWGCSGNGSKATGFTSLEGATDMEIAGEEYETVINLTASESWTITSTAPWLKVEPDSGEAGSYSVTIKAEANPSTVDRKGYLRFACGEDVRVVLVHQEVMNFNPSGGGDKKGPFITDAYSEELHYSTGRLRTTSAVMQSFDIDTLAGNIYYSQLNRNYRAYVSCGQPNSTATPPCMTLNYYGHVSNFTLEVTSEGKRYIWVDNFSSKNASGEYWGSPVVSRVPYSSGVTYNAWDAPDNYYFGEKNISVAVDIDNDMLTYLGISTGNFKTYRLSELRALPIENITLDAVTYGGESNNDTHTTEITKQHTIKARDCTKATPIGAFQIQREKYADGVQVSWQGFDIHDGLIYQLQGNGHEDGTPSPGWIQIRKIDGTVILPLTKFAALDDLAALKAAGITDTGYMEPEGVKVRGEWLYCGFCSKNAAGVRMGTIFRYNKSAINR